MKILVFAHRFGVGGSQVNTVDLTAALRDRYGHDVAIFATPGAMVKVAEERGIRFLPAPDVRTYPSLAMMKALRSAVRSEKPDLIHVWDWWQCLDAYYGVYISRRLPMVLSDMVSEGINRFLPKSLPTTFGTPELVDSARAAGRRNVSLLLPPVDIHYNAPSVVDPRAFRADFHIHDDEILLVTVSRLVVQLKSESLRRTIGAVNFLGRHLPLRYVIVGDGNARPELERLASATNDSLGRPAVILAGELLDPRPAYNAADIVVGMGGSALRGMAFAKPVIVVGEGGFSSVLTSETADWFLYYGLYGRGNGGSDNIRHIEDIRTLVTQRETLPRLGAYSRDFVTSHFSVEAVCCALERLIQDTMASMPPSALPTFADGLRTAAILLWGRHLPNAVRQAIRRREQERMSALRIPVHLRPRNGAQSKESFGAKSFPQ